MTTFTAVLHKGNYLSLLREDRPDADGGYKSQGYEYVERNSGKGAVQIVACLPGDKPEDARILIIEQRRPAVDKRILELPAGIYGDHDPNEMPEAAAERELVEETGYSAGSMHFMSQGPSCSGLCNELTSFFLATDLTKVGTGGGVDNENITVHEAPLIHIGPWLAERSLMVDPRIWSGLYLRIAFLTQRPDIGRL